MEDQSLKLHNRNFLTEGAAGDSKEGFQYSFEGESGLTRVLRYDQDEHFLEPEDETSDKVNNDSVFHHCSKTKWKF